MIFLSTGSRTGAWQTAAIGYAGGIMRRRSFVQLLLLALPFLLGACASPARLRPAKRPQLSFSAPRAEQRSLSLLLETALTQPVNSANANEALGAFVEQWHKNKLPHEALLDPASDQAPSYQVKIQSALFEGKDALTYFDDIQSQAGMQVLNLTHHRREGLGAPLIGLRENRHSLAIENYYPPEAINRPLTAVIEPGPRRGQLQQVTIQILCPFRQGSVHINGRTEPLAADFTAPWAAALSRTGRLRRSAILDMLTQAPSREPQLYLMEPYDPRKEPLIMIHGLLSTPLAWAAVSNDLWADESIRKRYQIWHFLYNTSAPALYSARQLRTQLAALRPLLDPEGDDPAMQQTTLLVHSMGGLVAKGLVVRPGQAFWEAAFTVPPASLKLNAADRATLNDAFEWQPDPRIHRIIFVCTPHRGSAFADNAAGRIGSWLTKPPTQFEAFYRRVSADNPGAFTPAYAALGRGELDSVSALSPRQPTLRILADLPFPEKVRVHSIIGNRGKPGPLEKSSDGIVPYTSSHLEGADTELIVPAGHGAFRHPAAKTEILRLLKLP